MGHQRNLLSICVDSNKEPFKIFIIRYQNEAKEVPEFKASKENKIKIYSEKLGLRIDQNIFWFTRGTTTYYLSEAQDMGSGVIFIVYESGKKVRAIFRER